MKINSNDKISFKGFDISRPLTVKDLQRATGYNKKKVQESIEELLEKGFLKVFKRTKKGVMYIINYKAMREAINGKI